MSYTIHSIPRRNLPASDTRLVMRAMAGIQDATNFQEARDALLRYYYPVLRTLRRDDARDPAAFAATEDWALELLHTGSKGSTAIFCEKVCLAKNGLPAEVVEELHQRVVEARKRSDASPYERVGGVLAWLKENRRNHPELAWSHSALRQWMQGLLTDFTLADAKKQPGRLLNQPEVHYEAMIASWDSDKTGLPFHEVWELGGQMWFTEKADDGIKSMEMDEGRQGSAAFRLRAKLLQESVPGMALMTNANLGVTRKLRPTWRDVTDYGVLHPLLTLDEKSFDKNVWLDFLQHRGEKWSSPAHEAVWHDWQEAAQSSYQRVLQAYAGSTPHAILYEASKGGVNSLEVQAVGALPLDWYKVVTELGTRFPYLNQSAELDEVAALRLDPAQLAVFKAESKTRVGQPLIHALIDLPKSLADVNTVNMPGWFHVRLQEEMTEKKSLALPDNLLDDDQSPPLY